MSAALDAVDRAEADLTERERAFLARQLRSTQRYAVFTAVDLVVALALTAWWFFDGFGGTRFALIVLVLLHARANLKQHKDAVLLAKLERLLDSSTRDRPASQPTEFVKEAREQFEQPSSQPG